MKYTSILEKILCLFNILFSSWIDLVILGIIFIIIILYATKKISKRFSLFSIISTYLLFLGLTIYNRFNNLSTVANSIIDNMFTNIYFPSVYAYLFILLFINITSIVSFLNIKLDKIYKILNGIVLFISNYIFILILEIIGKNNIDIYSKTSLFSNTNLIVMLELSISVFIIWLIITISIYTINKLTERIIIHNTNKELNNNPVNIVSPTLEIQTNEEEIKDEYKNKESITTFIPKYLYNNTITPSVNNNIDSIMNIQPIIYNNTKDNSLDLNDLIAPKQDLKPIINTNNLINNEISTKKTEQEIEKNTYTLNDYRIFNKMLKDIKEHNQNNTITIDKNLEYRLITKYSNETYNMFKKMLKNYEGLI